MADRSSLDERLLREKWEKLLAEHWVAAGEKILWFRASRQGYAGSVVGGHLHVPHKPLNEVRETTLEPPHWPLPSEPLTNGDFLGDEWADDPSITWWAHAAQPGQDAVRFADHFAAGYDQTFLVASTKRIAVVVSANVLAAAKPEPAAESKGLFGRARQVVQQAQNTVGELSSMLNKDNSVVSFHEVEVGRVRRMSAVHFGRSIPRSAFLRIDFTDGSQLLVNSTSAEKDSGTFNAQAR